MKKNILLPFALSSFVLALTGCGGGESTTIKEDPYSGVKTTTNGCDTSADSCQAFVIAYPVAGLNFDCSSDTKNHFQTEQDGNTVTGACRTGDKIHFYIQGESTSRKVDLGKVNLAEIAPVKVRNDQPLQISLLDIAKGMTGKDAAEMSLSDPTFKTTVGLAKLFQAIGQLQESGSEGDVQPIELTVELKNKLNALAADVVASDFTDGTYIADLKPWIDISNISDEIGSAVAEQMINLKNVNVYSASYLPITAVNFDVEGFHGISQTKKESIANLYIITDRSGYSTGYAVQWKGVPISTESALSRIDLLNQVAPDKLDLVAQGKAETSIKGWLNPLTDRIQTPLTLKKAIDSADQMNIFQGKLLNQKTIPGNEFMYKKLTGATTAPTDPTVYGKWNQKIDGEDFTGSIDLYKTNPATYLSNQIFKTINTVKAGENYIFPLYANLTFKFDTTSIPSQKIGIVIDENGNIRTNLGANSLASDQCGTVDANYVDTNTKVQQYRIGTTGAANSSTNDKSITIRMILANKIFGNLDGAMIGLNQKFSYTTSEDVDDPRSSDSSGVRINLQNLVVSNTTQNGINITSWTGETANSAKWLNMHAVAQSIYEGANSVTTASDLAKRQTGSIESIDLLPCYQIKKK